MCVCTLSTHIAISMVLLSLKCNLAPEMKYTHLHGHLVFFLQFGDG